MESPNTRYMPAVDHLRLFAALMVLMFHGVGRYDWPSPGWPRPQHWPTLFITEGYAGVSLFMVLSGFILTYASLGKHVGYRPFLRNRTLRLLPLLTVIFVLAVISEPATLTPRLLWFAVARANVGPGPSIFVMAAWSVFVEIELYLVFPLLLRLLDEGGPRRLLAIIAILAAVRFVVLSAGVDQRIVLYGSVLSRADQFLLGMLAAWVLRRRPTRGWGLAAPVGMALSVLLMASLSRGRAAPATYSTALGHQWAFLSPTAEGLGWACLVMGYVALMRGRSGTVTRAVARIGATSYSIYLFQSVVISVLLEKHLRLYVGHTLFTQSFVSVALLVLPVTLVVARVSYNLIELPFLRRRVRWIEEPPHALPIPLPVAPAGAVS